MIIQYRTFSECGPRYQNEDAVGYALLPEHQRAMFILCDGMGGHHSGDIASQTVAKAICNYWMGNPKRRDCSKKIVDACNVAKVALEKRPQVEMGTTMVMVALEDGFVRIAHCGDSRCYHFHRWSLSHWHTIDHRARTPESWEYVSKGFIQGEDTYLPEINEYALSSGDIILLCSDGLYNCFSTDEINHLLESTTDIDELYALLLKCGKEKAHDNFSAIIIKIIDV